MGFLIWGFSRFVYERSKTPNLSTDSVFFWQTSPFWLVLDIWILLFIFSISMSNLNKLKTWVEDMPLHEELKWFQDQLKWFKGEMSKTYLSPEEDTKSTSDRVSQRESAENSYNQPRMKAMNEFVKKLAGSEYSVWKPRFGVKTKGFENYWVSVKVWRNEIYLWSVLWTKKHKPATRINWFNMTTTVTEEDMKAFFEDKGIALENPSASIESPLPRMFDTLINDFLIWTEWSDKRWKEWWAINAIRRRSANEIMEYFLTWADRPGRINTDKIASLQSELRGQWVRISMDRTAKKVIITYYDKRIIFDTNYYPIQAGQSQYDMIKKARYTQLIE